MRYFPDLLERPQLPIWQLPVAYDSKDTRMYTLREIVDSKPVIKIPGELGSEEWHQLVLTQMKMSLLYEEEGRTMLTYQLSCPEGTVSNTRQAIQEIESRSKLGEQIVKNKREYLIALLEDIYGVVL